MLDVVNGFKEKDTPAVVTNLILDGFPSEEVVDGEEYAGVDEEVHCHFVLY